MPSIKVKNVCISDAVTGQIIFQKVYAWKQTATAFSSLGSLLQGFYQFAREVDDGVIEGIDFESSVNDSTSIFKRSARRKRDDVLKSNHVETMHLETVKTEEIIVSVFFDLGGKIQPTSDDKSRFQSLLVHLVTSFENGYLSHLKDFRKENSIDPKSKHGKDSGDAEVKKSSEMKSTPQDSKMNNAGDLTARSEISYVSAAQDDELNGGSSRSLTSQTKCFDDFVHTVDDLCSKVFGVERHVSTTHTFSSASLDDYIQESQELGIALK